jgi:hypothetical protein
VRHGQAPILLGEMRQGRGADTEKAGAGVFPRRNTVPLPDGSGSLRLPAGWQIGSAVKGMVSAGGPEGSVDLGIWFTVFTPQAAAQQYLKCPTAR